jgi:hypothetical protein
MSLLLNSSIIYWMLGWNELNLDSMLVKSEGLVKISVSSTYRL